jgi:hypothetical protein
MPDAADFDIGKDLPF